MRQRLLVVRILWIAFVMSQLSFPVVAFVVPRPPTVPEPVMAIVIGVAALGAAVVSFVLPSRMLAAGLRQLDLEIAEEVGGAAPGRFGNFYRDAAGKQRVFADPEQALSRGFPAFQTSFILSLALSEAVTIFGLPLAVLGFGPPVFVPFFVVGALLVAIRFPSLGKLRAALERAYGASLGAARVDRPAAPRGE